MTMESTSDSSKEDSVSQEDSNTAAAPQIKAASNKTIGVASTYYSHVHFFAKTGRWGAWVRCAETKKRLYLGTHKTKHLAARCQDRANLKLKNKGAILNFSERDYAEDKEMRENLSDAAFFKFLRAESRNCYKRVGKSSCLQKFMAQERSDLENSSTSQGRGTSACETASKNRPRSCGRGAGHALSSRLLHKSTRSRIRKPERKGFTYLQAYKKKGYNLNTLAVFAMEWPFASG